MGSKYFQPLKINIFLLDNNPNFKVLTIPKTEETKLISNLWEKRAQAGYRNSARNPLACPPPAISSKLQYFVSSQQQRRPTGQGGREKGSGEVEGGTAGQSLKDLF